MANVGVLGAGSWGTALSVLLSDNGHQVTVWSIDENEVKMLNEKREHELKLPGVKLMAVGAAFNFLSGTVKRAPVSWQKAGFEWLWRILHEPKQFFRYVKSAIVCFVTRDR